MGVGGSVRGTVVALAASAWLCSPAGAQTGAIEGVAAKSARIDALFARWDRPDTPGFAVGILDRGELVHARGYGIANLEYGMPITSITVFRTGSLGKQFTAMCIALLAEAGRISLDDDIRQYLPEMPDYATPVEVQHLVHQTSGIRDYLVLQGLAGRVYDYYFTQAEALDLLARQQALNFTPGERYVYSNSNYVLLAEIVSRVSGRTLAQFANDNIFVPLEMHDTHVHDDRNRIVRNRASGYAVRDDGSYRIDMTQLEIVGDGAVFTTLEDFARWDRNLFRNRLAKGSRSLLDTVFDPGTLNDGSPGGYAFGQMIDTYRGLDRIRHTGSYKGYKASNTLFPDLGVAVIILANRSDWNTYELTEDVIDIYLDEHLAGEKTPLARTGWQGSREAVELADAPLGDGSYALTGSYYASELDATAQILIEQGRLLLQLNRTTDVLRPAGGDRFATTYINDDAYEPMDRQVTFVRAADGSVEAFRMDAAPILGIEFVKTGRSIRRNADQ